MEYALTKAGFKKYILKTTGYRTIADFMDRSPNCMSFILWINQTDPQMNQTQWDELVADLDRLIKIQSSS